MLWRGVVSATAAVATSGHREWLAPIAHREYDDLQKRLSDPHSTESRVEGRGSRVEEAMASDPAWQASWQKRQRQRKTTLEAGKLRHALMEKQKDGSMTPRVLFVYDNDSGTSH